MAGFRLFFVRVREKLLDGKIPNGIFYIKGISS